MTIVSQRMSKTYGLIALVRRGEAYAIVSVDLETGSTEEQYSSDDLSDECYRGIRRTFRGL